MCPRVALTPVDVHELRVRKELQEEADTRRVGGRLEQQAHALAASAQRELAQHQLEACDPARAIAGGCLLKGEVRSEGRLIRHEKEREVGRDAGREHSDADLVLRAENKRQVGCEARNAAPNSMV